MDDIIVEVRKTEERSISPGSYELIVGVKDMRCGVIIPERSSAEWLISQLHRLASGLAVLVVEDRKRTDALLEEAKKNKKGYIEEASFKRISIDYLRK